MSSTLVITDVEELQNKINAAVKTLSYNPGIYVSLNKTQKSIEEIFKSNGIEVDRLFFIDCVTSEKTRDDVLHISPNSLDMLYTAIEAFINDIEQDKFLVIDALSTLLIYNDENKVAQFAKKLADLGAKKEVEILAFSPKTKGEELLNKIFNFFDRVNR
jgi:archaellum biogenesis ATPase FlaH